MDKYRIIPVDESYNGRILSILDASPVQANGLSLQFDKSPDIFAISRMKYSECLHLGIFSGDDMKGFASLGFYNALVKGKEERISTFYNFFILPEARGNRLSALVMKEFISVAGNIARFGIAITLRGNRPVETYIARGNEYLLPQAHVVDSLCVKSILFSFPKKNTSTYRVRNALKDDIPEIVKLLNMEHSQRDMGLIFRDDEFHQTLKRRGVEIENYFVATDRNGFIKGVCLAWDCTSFRRTRLIKASPKFYPLLYSYKALSKVLMMAPFPDTGECFSELTITDYAVADRNVNIMNALLAEIYYRNLNGKYHFMNFGSCISDDLLNAVSGFWHHNNVSHIAFTCLDKSGLNIEIRLPYIDIAFL